MRKRVSLNGIEIVYDERDGDSRPLLLVHGFTGAADDFQEHLEPLAALGRTIAVDLRGHGDSTNTNDPAGYTLDQLVDDLRAFLDTLAIDRVDLLGHSMGGMVALRFALANPQRVASLLLMDTAARAIPGVPRGVFEGAARFGRDAGMPELAKLLRARAETDTERPPSSRRCEDTMGSQRFWERIDWKLASMDPEAFGQLGCALVDQESIVPRLNEIECPTLIIVGAEDRPFLVPADELERGIAGAARVTIAHAAHSPQLENPPAWFEAVRDHVKRVRAR